MQGSLGYSGTYAVSDKTLIFNIGASTYPNAEGTEKVAERIWTSLRSEL